MTPRLFRPGPYLVLAAALAVSPALAAKVESHWEDLPQLPTPRQEVGVAALDNVVYVIGGILANTSATGAVERFDVEAHEWEPVAPLPDDVRLHHVGAASAAGLVFAVGGLDSSFRGVTSVFAFHPSKGAWTRRADLPQPRGAMGVASDGVNLYAAGGQNGGTSYGDFFVHRAKEDRWETLPRMPTARNHLAAAVVDGVFYAVGGRAGRLFGTLEAYDPVSRRWVELAPMPTPRGGLAAAAWHDWILVFGGEGNSADPNGIFADVEGYDICRGVWERDEDMPHPRHGIGAATAPDFGILIPGGSPVQGFGVTDVHDVFFPGSLGPPGPLFIRGDANRDDAVDISDGIFILVELFLRVERSFPCEDAADANNDGAINIADAMTILGFLFLAGPPPPPPGPDFPGVDDGIDELECSQHQPIRCIDPFEE